MKYGVMTNETLDKMAKCFSSIEELMTHIHHLEELAREITFLQHLKNHMPSDATAHITMKQLATMVIFFRENLETIRELLGACEVKELSEEEAQKMQEKLKKQYDAISNDDNIIESKEDNS